MLSLCFWTLLSLPLSLASPAEPLPLPAAMQDAEAAAVAPWESVETWDGLHLGGYSSVLGGRILPNGTLDAGQGLVRLLDGSTGEPLAVVERRTGYSKGPQLWAQTDSKLGDVDVHTVALGIALSSGPDTRLTVAMQVRLTNTTDTARKVVLGAVMRPGSASPILPSLGFSAGTGFARDGRLITRDGLAALSWVGDEPEVEVFEDLQSPDALGVRLLWRMEIPAGEKRFVEVKLAGLPSTDTQEDEAWNARFLSRTYSSLEEKLVWQGRDRGSIMTFRSRSDEMQIQLRAGAHCLRLFGAAGMTSGLSAVSDRPFGRPATDAAAQAGIIGLLIEFGMANIGTDYLYLLIDEMDERMAPLSPERRLAYLHGVARGLRMLGTPTGADRVAAAILALDDPDVAVEVWHDPAVVRQDLLLMFELAELDVPDTLNKLRWAEASDEASVAGRMQALRRSISARHGNEAWELFTSLTKSSSSRGLGSMNGPGSMDGSYSMGMMTLARAMLIDDHGPDLNMFPANASPMVDLNHDVETPYLYTRFGKLKARFYYSTKVVMGAGMVFQPKNWPERMTVTVPDGFKIVRMHGRGHGARVDVLDDRLIAFELELNVPGGSRFSFRVRKL